ncbi:MAG: hypothetical protein AAB692_04320 [Patescibacteria group bacterium]
MPRKKKHAIGNLKLSLAMLLFALALSAINLEYATSRVGTLDASQQASSGFSAVDAAYVPKPPEESSVPETAVLFDDVSGKAAADPVIQSNLLDPLVDYYSMAGPSLKAVLIERKNAASEDVRVRLFFDGENQDVSFLWPSQRSSGGWWTPPCGSDDDLAAGRADDVCPAEWSAKYPDILALE